MQGLSMLARSVGRFLLRCLVGRYGTILLTGVLAILVGAGAYLSLLDDNAGSDGADQGTVYSVAAVDANLARAPRLWLGRTIQVRGELEPCIVIPSVGAGPCAVLTSGSRDSYDLEGLSRSPALAANPLPITQAGLDPLRAPQVPRWGVVATYRVQLASVPDGMCDGGACAEARLLDSAP